MDKTKIVVLGLGAAIFAATGLLAHRFANIAEDEPQLILSTPAVELGSILLGRSNEFVVSLGNSSGSKPIEILKLVPSCSCVSASLPGRQVGPKESLELRIAYRPRLPLGRQREAVAVSWKRAGDNAEYVSVVDVTAQVDCAFVPSKERCYFASNELEGSRQVVALKRAGSNLPWERIRLRSKGTGYSASLEVSNDDEGAIVVTRTAETPSNPESRVIELTETNAAPSQEQMLLHLPVYLDRERLQSLLSPEFVYLGKVKRGQEIELAFNLGGEHEASEIEVVCDQLKIRVKEVRRRKEGGSRCLLVGEVPSGRRALSASIVFRVAGAETHATTARVLGIVEES